MIFCCVFNLAIAELEDFSDLWKTVKKTFELAMGQFSFSDFDDITNA